MRNAIKFYISKLVYALGVLTILFGLYCASFYVVSNQVLLPYEQENYGKTHTLRPVYNVVYAPLRKFVSKGAFFRLETIHIEFGTLKWAKKDSLNSRTISLKPLEGRSMYLEFESNASVLDAFDRVEAGSYVRLRFGSKLAKDSNRFIRRLDEFEVIDLMDDPRVAEKNYSSEESSIIYETYSSLEGEEKVCADGWIKNYKEQVLEHCLQAGYGYNVGGGCYHLLPYFVTPSAQVHVLELCAPDKLVERLNVP